MLFPRTFGSNILILQMSQLILRAIKSFSEAHTANLSGEGLNVKVLSTKAVL